MVGWMPDRRRIRGLDTGKRSGAARGHFQEVTNLGLEPGEKWWLETVVAVGVGEIALGEKQKTGQWWKIESHISGNWK